MRYLGIDPGTTIIGYGVIEEIRGVFRSLEYGVIRNPGKDSSADKQATVAALKELIARHTPDRAAVERLFFLNNKNTAFTVSEMRGVIMLSLADHRVPTMEFTPMQVKQRVCGSGRADKKQVQRMVRLLLKIQEEVKPDDAADALALALCCATATISAL
jgi:crossover junction endodeoxyribonuclease RuvC